MRSKTRSSATNRWRMDLADEVDAILRRLAPREEHVLRLRFGIGKRNQKIDGIAESLSLTPAAVRRIESATVRELWAAAAMEAHSDCADTG